MGKAWLGVEVEDGYAVTMPDQFAIDTRYIGGPSAGLAMTLAIMAKLSKHSLTGGHAVAATGTMDIFGNVGDVGGVAEKTVAVERAGVKYFIVPQVEVATARAVAGSHVRIFGVTTLGQALADLRLIGGSTSGF
jgi:PDZ domain-containing protein